MHIFNNFFYLNFNTIIYINVHTHSYKLCMCCYYTLNSIILIKIIMAQNIYKTFIIIFIILQNIKYINNL